MGNQQGKAKAKPAQKEELEVQASVKVTSETSEAPQQVEAAHHECEPTACAEAAPEEPTVPKEEPAVESPEEVEVIAPAAEPEAKPEEEEVHEEAPAEEE